MENIDLKSLTIRGFHLEENCTGHADEVFYVSDTSEDDSIEIIPDCYNNARKNEKYYIILYLKDCQTAKAEVYVNDIEDTVKSLNNINAWINLTAAGVYGKEK